MLDIIRQFYFQPHFNNHNNNNSGLFYSAHIRHSVTLTVTLVTLILKRDKQDGCAAINEAHWLISDDHLHQIVT